MTKACIQLASEFEYYVNHIAPVYSYLVALKGQKPIQVLIELENTFSHMAQACQDIEPEKNIERAHNHLSRLETDLYKLLLVELLEDLERKQKKDSAFIMLSRKARDNELKAIGSDGHHDVIASYREAVNKALCLLGHKELDDPQL